MKKEYVAKTIEYRSEESYQDIIDSCNNGNWKQAGEIGAKYGRYAQDLLNRYEEGDLSDWLADLVLLVEMITEARYK